MYFILEIFNDFHLKWFIEAANSGTAQQSVGKNESVHLAKLLEKMGEIDWKKIESLVGNGNNIILNYEKCVNFLKWILIITESSANQPIAGA